MGEGGRVQRQKCEREGEATASIVTSAHPQRNGIATSLQRHRNTSTVCDFQHFHSSHLGPFHRRISFRMASGVFFSIFGVRFTERKAPHRYPRRFLLQRGKLRPGGVYIVIAPAHPDCHDMGFIRVGVWIWITKHGANESVVRIYDTPSTGQTHRCRCFWPTSGVLILVRGCEGGEGGVWSDYTGFEWNSIEYITHRFSSKSLHPSFRL